MSEQQLHPPRSDRERRAELEQLQAELRDTRARLAMGGKEKPPDLVALEEQVADARTQLAAAKARTAGLQAEVSGARERIDALKRDLEEERVFKLGRSRRDRYVDWAPPGTVPNLEPGRRSSTHDSPLLLLGPAMLIAIFFVLHQCSH